ncbi:MAG: thioesterase family protein [Candidatus Promineifilaceae bacterium]
MLPKTTLTVLPEWIDHNGHMNVAYYVLAFDLVTDAVYETWGLGLDYPDRENCSIFTIGMNVDYLGEVFEGEPLHITTQLVDMDHKRIHYLHSMSHGETGALIARNECLCMNVRLDTRRSASFPQSVLDRITPVFETHRQLVRPDGFGRTLQIRRK